MAVDRNGVTIRVNDHMTVHPVQGDVSSAIVCEITNRATVNAPGHWVEVDCGQGRESFPSYILEVVSTPREPEPEYPGAIEVGSRVATPHGTGTVQFIDSWQAIVVCDDGQERVYSSHRLRLLELQLPGPEPVEIRTNEDLERHLGMSWVPGEEGLPPPPAATPLAHDINGRPIFSGDTVRHEGTTTGVATGIVENRIPHGGSWMLLVRNIDGSGYFPLLAERAVLVSRGSPSSDSGWSVGGASFVASNGVPAASLPTQPADDPSRVFGSPRRLSEEELRNLVDHLRDGGYPSVPHPEPPIEQPLAYDRAARPIYVGARVSHIAEGNCVAVGANSSGNVVVRVESDNSLLVASPINLTIIQETAPASQDPQPTAVDRYGSELRIGQTVRLSSIRPDDAINSNTWRGVITGITNEPSARVSRSGVLIEVRDIGHEGPLRRLLNSFDLIVVNPSSDRTSSPQPWSVPAPVDSGGVPIRIGDRVALNAPSLNRYGVVTAINVSTIWVDYGRGESGPCRPSAVRVIQEWTPSQPEVFDSGGTRLEVGQWVQVTGCSAVARVTEITTRRTHMLPGYWLTLQTEDTRLAELPSYNLTVLSGVEESDMRVVWISGARQLPSVSDALEGKVVARNRAGDGRYVISFIKWDAVTASHDWVRGLKGFNVANSITTLAPVEDIPNERSIEI